jgi:hypothetical protein
MGGTVILIGFGHKARQGKNFVANYMVEQNLNIKLYAFADELKLYCKEHHESLVKQYMLATYPYPMSLKPLLPPKDDPIYGYTQILQWYGTDVARVHDPDTWVKALDKRLLLDDPEVAIVCDVRFPNEAAYIKEKGGHLIEVRRLNADGSQFLDKGRDPNHPSETALDNYEGWDYIIEAKDGDLKGLKAKSVGVYNLITKPEDYVGYIDEATDIDWDVLDTYIADLDSQGDGFKS